MSERSRVEFFDLRHVESGLSFPDQAIQFSGENLNRLKRHTKKLLGQDRDTNWFLITNGGLDHPAVLHGGNEWLTFSSNIVSVHYEPWQFKDTAQYSAAENNRVQSGYSEELKGRRFEIWSMSWHPNSSRPGYFSYLEESSPLLDPEVDTSQLAPDIAAIYRKIARRHPLVEDLRPAVLVWRMPFPDNRIRVATRPYRAGRVDTIGQPIHQNNPSIHTAFPPRKAE